MNINQFYEVEIFLQKDWIPIFIDKIIRDKIVFDFFPVNDGRREEFETIFKEALIDFNETLSIKRLQLLKKVSENDTNKHDN